MNWLKKKAAQFIQKQMKGNPFSDGTFFSMFGSGGGTYAGVEVSYTSAMRTADVYTCVRIKSEALGQLPVKLYRTDKNNIRRQIFSGREHTIFTVRPNSYMTWQEFIEMYVTVMEIQGNFYAEIRRNMYNSVYELVPLKYQSNVEPYYDLQGNVRYVYTTNDGKGRTETITYGPRDILHIKLNNTDGIKGLSPITQAAREIGMSIAATNAANSLFENGNAPAGVLSTDQTFGDDDNSVARLRRDWESTHGGSSNRGKVAILDAGLKFQSIQMSSVDAQLLEVMQLSRERVASLFGIPSHRLNVKDGMKYNTVEHNNTGFFRDSLMPLATKLENNINLILPDNHFIALDEKSFVRGDRKTQVEILDSELKSGALSLNEYRIEMGREPMEGGDVFAIHTNNLTFGTYDDIATMRKLDFEKMKNDAKPKEPSAPIDNNTKPEETT